MPTCINPPPGRITDSTPTNQSPDVPQSERDKKIRGEKEKNCHVGYSSGRLSLDSCLLFALREYRFYKHKDSTVFNCPNKTSPCHLRNCRESSSPRRPTSMVCIAYVYTHSDYSL